MNRIMSIVMFTFAVSGTVFLVYMVLYVLGFRKNNLIYVTGFLQRTELQKNVFRGHPFSGKWHKHWTNYTYVYRVNEQQYAISGGISGQRKDVPLKVTVAVQKNAPKNAIIPQFEKAPSMSVLFFLLVGCAVFYTTGVCLWYI